MEDDDEIKLDEQCPNCDISYDDIDYEYQICHHCHHDNNPEEPSEEPTEPDLMAPDENERQEMQHRIQRYLK